LAVGRVALALVALVVLGARPAVAQIDQGRITGTVTDAQGGVLPGVTVTATSPSLIGVQAVITEGDGKYRFPALPSGRYVLTFELPGFQTLKRENLVLTIGQTLTIDIQLQVATLEETVTVTTESPMIDLQSTKVGTEFTQEKLTGIPTSTDIWAVLGQAQGVRMTGFDVGGSHKSQQSGYESFGIRNQNRVVNDGIDTTEGSGGSGFYADYFVNEEISVSAAGGDVEMNTPGSAVVQTVKSGGNTFRSLNNISYEGESFVGNNLDDETARRGYTGQPNLLFWEAHTDVGGPIRRDKIWFYAAYNHFKIDKVVSGVPREIATDIGIFDNATVKATAKLTSKDTLVGYYQWGRKQKPYRGLSATVSPDAVLAQDSNSWLYKGEWQRIWSNRLYSVFRYAWFGYGWPMAPNVDYKTNPPRIDTATGFESGAGWAQGTAGGPFVANRAKPQITGLVTYYLPEKAGDHDLKFGFEWQDDQSEFANNGASGPVYYRDRNGVVDEIRLTDLGDPGDFGGGWTANDDRNKRLSFYAQDRWSVAPRLTLTLGLRFDRQQPYYVEGKRTPILSDIFPTATSPETTLLTSDTWAPRAGVSYDLTGKGTTVVKAFWGRYNYNYADRLSGLNPGGINTRDYKFLDQNGNRLYDGPQELGALVASTGGTSTRLDAALKTPYANEFSVSLDRQFWGESSVRVAYVRKMIRDEFATINRAREGQFTEPRQVTITLREFGSTTTEARTYTVYDIPASLRGVTQNTVMNIPDGDMNYDTLQFAFNKRFGRGLFVSASYDYQWRDELRANSSSTSPLNTDPIAPQSYFQNVNPAVPNRQSNTNWQARAMARYVWNWDIGSALNLRWQSGFAYSRILQATGLVAGTQSFYEEPIENNRSDDVAILDLRVDKTFRFKDRYSITIMGDVFNLLNTNAVSNFFLVNGANYNRIIATIDPRTAQIAARFAF
jgi:hypothetical protein